MLCRKFRHTIFAQKALINNVQYQYLIRSRFFSKRCFLFDRVLAYKSDSRLRMSAIRFVLRDLSVARLWSAWTRSFIVNTVVRRCRRERSVREVFQCFRQTILRPRRTFLLSATAAFKSRSDDDETPPSCEQSITDEELEALMSQLEDVQHLSKNTLYCAACGLRLTIDKRLPAVRYCACKEPKSAEEAPGGWAPYMEAEDVVIWRKEYKPGLGLYAYKVYGRYKDVKAEDFAAVQVDGSYRRAWDSAVASLSVVERRANGLRDQAVLHWEVLWPRLFANRDYVYIRRHKEFDVRTRTGGAGVLDCEAETRACAPAGPPERESVHSRAKRAAMEADRRVSAREVAEVHNKAFIIVSRSCSHPRAPESKHAIRVTEYWSHMVVRSTQGPREAGMEFVLTYYDEPSVGGRCSAVAAWATGRAAAAYLLRMRRAAAAYRAWAASRPTQELPDFTPFGDDHTESASLAATDVREQDMESSKHGPELDNGSETMRDQYTQTEVTPASTILPASNSPASEKPASEKPASEMTASEKPASEETASEIPSLQQNTSAVETPVENTSPSNVVKDNKREVLKTNIASKKEDPQAHENNEKVEEDEAASNGSWWRYLYPFYYFV